MTSYQKAAIKAKAFNETKDELKMMINFYKNQDSLDLIKRASILQAVLNLMEKYEKQAAEELSSK